MRSVNNGANLASSMNKTLNDWAFQAIFEKPNIKTASIKESVYDDFSEELVNNLFKCATDLENLNLNKSSKLILLAASHLIDEITDGMKSNDSFKPKDIPPPVNYPEKKPDLTVEDKDLIDMTKPESPQPLNQ